MEIESVSAASEAVYADYDVAKEKEEDVKAQEVAQNILPFSNIEVDELGEKVALQKADLEVELEQVQAEIAALQKELEALREAEESDQDKIAKLEKKIGQKAELEGVLKRQLDTLFALVTNDGPKGPKKVEAEGPK